MLASLVCATTVRPPTLDELVAHADCVVRGTVTATRSEWRQHEGERFIVTIVTVQVQEAIVGEGVGPSLELEFLGGEIDGQGLVVEGQPRFRPGDEDFLFIAGNGTRICPLVAMMYGRYLIAQDEAGQRLVARSNGVPLASVAEMAEPLDAPMSAARVQQLARSAALSPAEFAAAIRDSARRQGRRDIPSP